MKMKKSLSIFLSALLLLSLFACGKTEVPETPDTQNEKEEENQQPGNEEQDPGEDDKEKGEEEEPVPTDPVSKEVYDLKHNEDLVQAPLSYHEHTFTNDGHVPEVPVYIWNDHLQFEFVIPKNTLDATVGFDAEDMSDYHFSFKVYLREQGVEGAQYKSIHTNLAPWSIYSVSTLTIYRCLFYDSGLLDLVEVGKTYDIVIAVYENDKVIGWGESELTWNEKHQESVEAAEQHPDIVIK